VTKRIAAVVLLVLAAGVAALLLLAGPGRRLHRPAAPAGVVRTRETAPLKIFPKTAGPAPAAEKTRATLFFPSKEDGLLRAEARDLDRPADAVVFARELMAELAAGPRGDALAAALPPKFTLRNAFVPGGGLVVVDFDVDPAWARAAGSDEELAAAGAIVDTLLQNLAQTDRVKILVNGNDVETLAGHVDLSQPLPVMKDVLGVSP
jgi:germination protein M